MKDYSADAIEKQLERILASPDFVTGAKLGQFLSYVVGQKLRGRAETIQQFEIAVDALGYEPSFDPTNNPTVRILAGRVRRALDRYYVNQGASDAIRIEIPKGGYVPVFTDLATTQNATAASEISRVTGQPSHESRPLTVAVTQFESLSDRKSDNLIAVGLSAEIVVSLTRFSELTVLGPLAPENGEREHFYETLRRYGAGFALQGWIRTSGSRIRISTDLLDMSTGSSLWARTLEYDLDVTSLFEIEDEVTSQVAGVISDGLGIPFHRLHSESYQEHLKLHDVTEAVLAHHYYWTKISAVDWRRANDAVGEALAEHPDNALLNALQANLYYGDLVHCLDIFPNSVSKMEEYSHRAIAIDPELQIAQYNLLILNTFFGRAKECIAAARKVVAMNPNQARILAGSAVAVSSVGAFEFGRELIERAKRLNPQYPGWYLFVEFWASFHDGQYEEAWANARQIETPGLLWGSVLKLAALGKLGRVDEAQPIVEDLLQLKPDIRERSRDYVRRLFITDEHVDMICDGLEKAGLFRLPAVTS